MQLTIPQSVRAQLEFNAALSAAAQQGPRAALRRGFAAAAEQFASTHGHPPSSLADVQELVSPLPAYQTDQLLGGVLSRRMWRELGMLVKLNQADVDRELRSVPDHGLGELRLDPDLEEPAYYAQSEFHLAPGNYSGSSVYAIHNESQLTSAVTKQSWPGVKRIFESAIPTAEYHCIVDLGAGLGRSTVALKELFPQAEVIGIDFAEPELRYAHWESERRGLAITYVQADALRTGLASDSADLVTAYIVHHELPPSVMQELLREAYRLLRPGGVFVNGDVTPNRHMLPLTRYLLGNQVRTGAEPFWLSAGDMDLPAEYQAVGFTEVRELAPPQHPHGLHFPWFTLGQKPR